MATTHVNPTRMGLTRLKKKLTTAMRGHKLLKDKRDELMRQFLDLVRENKALREKVEAAILASGQNFVLARAGMTDEEVNLAMLSPKQEILIDEKERNVMSVNVPVFNLQIHTDGNTEHYNYGLAFTSGELDVAVAALFLREKM